MKNYFYILILLAFISLGNSQKPVIPDGFSDVLVSIPDISIDLRYFSRNNFVGDTINGYQCAKLILTDAATAQLKHVQEDLQKEGLGLLVYDGYRPQQAVDHFVKWARELQDTTMKAIFYPEVSKQHLFKEGYIASKSGHSRGSTLDVTLINLDTGQALDMGSPYDFFGMESWLSYQKLSESQKQNRQRLQHIMNKHGFRSYAKEWWHFTLRNEPYPKTYFNFPITCKNR